MDKNVGTKVKYQSIKASKFKWTRSYSEKKFIYNFFSLRKQCSMIYTAGDRCPTRIHWSCFGLFKLSLSVFILWLRAISAIIQYYNDDQFFVYCPWVQIIYKHYFYNLYLQTSILCGVIFYYVCLLLTSLKFYRHNSIDTPLPCTQNILRYTDGVQTLIVTIKLTYRAL